MTELTLDDIQNTLRDGFYVTVGLGVIAFQKAQVRRQELQKQLDGGVGTAKGALGDGWKTISERLDAVEQAIDGVLDEVEQQLPSQARSVMQQARTVAKDTRSQVTGMIESNL